MFILNLTSGSNFGEYYTFNIKEYKDYIINHELLQEVENINIDYGFNPVEEKKDAFLTIIGFQDGFTIAYQAELIIEDDNIFIGDPEYEAYLFNKHTCAGDGCESCKFKRKWFWGKIRGCKCTDGGSGICNHSVANEGGIFTKLINFFL